MVGKLLNLLVCISGVWWVFEIGMLGGYFIIWMVCVVGLEGCVVMIEVEVVNVGIVRVSIDVVGVGEWVDICVG